MEKYKAIYNVSLICIVCIVLTYTVCGFLRIVLPDMLIRIMGVVDLIAIGTLIFSAVKIRSLRKDQK